MSIVNNFVKFFKKDGIEYMIGTARMGNYFRFLCKDKNGQYYVPSYKEDELGQTIPNEEKANMPITAYLFDNDGVERKLYIPDLELESEIITEKHTLYFSYPNKENFYFPVTAFDSTAVLLNQSFEKYDDSLFLAKRAVHFSEDKYQSIWIIEDLQRIRYDGYISHNRDIDQSDLTLSDFEFVSNGLNYKLVVGTLKADPSRIILRDGSELFIDINENDYKIAPLPTNKDEILYYHALYDGDTLFFLLTNNSGNNSWIPVAVGEIKKLPEELWYKDNDEYEDNYPELFGSEFDNLSYDYSLVDDSIKLQVYDLFNMQEDNIEELTVEIPLIEKINLSKKKSVTIRSYFEENYKLYKRFTSSNNSGSSSSNKRSLSSVPYSSYKPDIVDRTKERT